MLQIELEVAEKNWHEILKIALQGKEVLITREQRPVLRLIRIAEQAERCRQLGSARGLITMRENFDEPLVDFQECL